jgi:L-iditol 2-dehydrogenase
VLVARLHSSGDLRLAEEARPDAAAGEELLRVTAVGLCGSDRHWYREGAIGDATLERPLVLGHEIAGIIDNGPRGGQRVAVDPAHPCERCDVCRAGNGHLCPDVRFAGHSINDGGLREFMAWPGRLMLPLPDSIGDAEAALLEPLGVALHAIDLARLENGATAAVIGCGPIGLLLIQLLRDAGCATVVAADPLPHRIAAALDLGATESAEPRADIVFEASGAAAAVELAVSAANPAGRVVLVGIPDDDRTSFSASAARRNELTVSIVRRMRHEDLARAIDLVSQRRIKLTPLITRELPLSNVVEAFAALAGFEGIKTVVRPNAGSS